MGLSTVIPDQRSSRICHHGLAATEEGNGEVCCGTKAVASTLASVEAFITPKVVPELNDVYHRDISQVVERDVCHLFFLAMRGYSRLASPSFITSICRRNEQCSISGLD